MCVCVPTHMCEYTYTCANMAKIPTHVQIWYIYLHRCKYGIYTCICANLVYIPLTYEYPYQLKLHVHVQPAGPEPVQTLNIIVHKHAKVGVERLAHLRR